MNLFIFPLYFSGLCECACVWICVCISWITCLYPIESNIDRIKQVHPTTNKEQGIKNRKDIKMCIFENNCDNSTNSGQLTDSNNLLWWSNYSFLETCRFILSIFWPALGQTFLVGAHLIYVSPETNLLQKRNHRMSLCKMIKLWYFIAQ